MADSVRANYVSQLNITEVIGNVLVNPNLRNIGLTGIDTALALGAATTPAVSMEAVFQVALSTGTHTIDLTSLPGPDGTAAARNGTGLKVRALKFQNPATNLNSISVTVGASNGYPFSGTDGKVTLAPGEEWCGLLADATAHVIDSSHKTLDMAGTGSQALNVAILMGA